MRFFIAQQPANVQHALDRMRSTLQTWSTEGAIETEQLITRLGRPNGPAGDTISSLCAAETFGFDRMAKAALADELLAHVWSEGLSGDGVTAEARWKLLMRCAERMMRDLMNGPVPSGVFEVARFEGRRELIREVELLLP